MRRGCGWSPAAERHATIDRSLRLLGFGTAATDGVGADANGAIDIADLRRVLDAAPDGPMIVCAAGRQRQHRRVR